MGREVRGRPSHDLAAGGALVRPGGQRKIARLIRERWPGALVRRASQAERAHNPDVFIEGGPRILQRLWLELQDSANATPLAKLAQARRDADADLRIYPNGEHRLPVAVTHQLGSRSVMVTIGLDDLMDIADPDRIHVEENSIVVTMELDHFIRLLAMKQEHHDGIEHRAYVVPERFRQEVKAA